ncbi:MAG: PEP-CTERM sorting domain-containing protein [Deltaproteobacteria bacterium]|nr:PEP-CTERM sorting domain-containing protein [Deltaproteobacteria bacterium]
MKKIWFLSLLAVILVFPGVSWSLSITPATTPQWSGSVPNNPDAGDVATIVGYSGTFVEYYKQDLAGPETGSFASSYETEFFNTPTDPEDATITYISGSSLSGYSPLYLLVKDGKHDPIWYIFDLVALSWNGTDDIELTDFWVGKGAISHVALYGPTTMVPEPAILILLGLGLIGIAGMRKK